MLQLNVGELKTALCAAQRIHNLEAARDQIKDEALLVHVDVPKSAANPFGQFEISVPVAKAEIRRQLEQRIVEAHNVLRSLGIELIPGRENEA